MKNDVCENNGRYTEIDIAKGIGILLVVIGHAVPDANTGIMNDFWGGLFSWIYSFHMALFMAMAGVLFYRKICHCNSIADKVEESRKRAIRLMLPYFTFSMLILIAKLVFSSWGRTSVSLLNFVDILFGNSPCGNMWFLWTLFVISIIILFLPKTEYFPLPLLAISFVIYFLQDQQPWFRDFGLGKVFSMLIWFVAGLLIGKNIKFFGKTRDVNSLVKLAVPVGLLFLQVILLKNKQDYSFPLVSKLILSALGIALVLSVSIFLANKENRVSNLFQYLGKNSMSIYVLSYFVQTPGVTLYRMMGDCGVPYDFWVMFLVIAALLFSLIAAKIIRKNIFFKLIFLGEQ